MVKVFKGQMVAKGLKFGIVVSRFNEAISKQLLEGCLDTLLAHGMKEEDIDVVWVPGAFEIPLVAMKVAARKKYQAVICLGAVIRGATPHFDYIASEVTKGIARVGLDFQIPVIFGVITADTIEQAIERAGTKVGNRGREAGLDAIEMATLVEKL